MEDRYYCDKCGKEIPAGQPATAITGGSIQESAGGFMPDDSPYYQVLCADCADGIARAVALMPITPAQEHAGALLARLEMAVAWAEKTPGAEGLDWLAGAQALIGGIWTEQKAERAAMREPSAEYYTPVEYMNCEGCGCRIGTFDEMDDEKRIFKTKYAREDCPACAAILCRKCAAKAQRRYKRSRKPQHERAACYACTHGTHPATTREPGAAYGYGGTDQNPQNVYPATTRAIIVITSPGGGVSRVLAADIPTAIWEDGEAREYIEEHGIVGALDGMEGYEIMSPEDARTLAAKLQEAGRLGKSHYEGTCPNCGAQGLKLNSEESDGEGGFSANWTCHKCGTTGTQQRAVVFIGHINIKPGAGAAEPPAIYRVHEYSEGRRFVGTLAHLDEIARREGATGPGFFSGQIDSRMRAGRKAAIWNGNECIADITRIK